VRINKSLITFTPTSGSGSGTVTSVAMTVPGGVFTIVGTPITTSGTLTLGLVNQLENTVWAGPTTAPEGVPTFRSLVSADIPNISASKITSGTLGVPRGGTGAASLTGVLFGNGTGAFTGIASTTANQLLRVNSVGTAYEWFTPDYLSNVMTSLGDMIYGNAVGLPVRRSGNTTTTKMYLSQTGDGTNSSAPQWSAIAVGDVSGAVSALTGEVSTTGSGSLNVTLGTTSVTGKLLTGLSVTSGAITSSDSILSAFGKVQGQINGLAGGSTYKGSWNASTNTPTIVSGTGTTGDYYIVSVAGSTTIDGISSWDVGDWIIFNGSVWQKIDNTDSVISVNGQVGSVVLTTANISENTNLYYTDARARAAISLTTTGASGAATYSSGVLNIPNYTIAGLGGISGSGTSNYLTKFTSATSIGNSIIAESAGLATIYGNGQVYVGQNGAGLTSLFITNDDNSFGNRHETKISTQALGSGLGRTIIQAASYNTSTNKGELAILTESGANYVANIGTLITGSDNAFSLYNTIFTENIRLNTGGNSWFMGGNVGIGNTTPYEKLEVSGAISSSGGWSANSSQVPVTTMGFQDGYGFVQAVDWGVEYKKLGLNPSGGYVGIGTTSPQQKLHIEGNASIGTTGTEDILLLGRPVTIGVSFEQAASLKLGRYQNAGAGFESYTRLDFALRDNSSVNNYNTNITVMTLTNAGNVGIGILLPTEKLHVSGNAIVTGTLTANTIVKSGGTASQVLAANGSVITAGSNITISGGTISATNAVASVFGRTGVVVAVSGDYTTTLVTEGSNLYYTEARVNANANVAANTAARHNAVTLGTANGLSLSTQVLSLALASSSATGALSSTDWNTFNNKQSTITNPITGTGTTNYIPKFTAAGSIGNSIMFNDSANNRIGINNTTPSSTLHLIGTFRADTSGITAIQTDTNWNFYVNATSSGVNAQGTLVMGNGSAPTSSPSDLFHIYSADVTAGNAAPHFRTENGAVIKLYQETTSVGNAIISLGGGSPVLDDTTFDGYTLRQIVKALRNQGILA
jgi:hypothetical protein